MNIQLHPDIQRFVDQEVEAGHFPDAETLVNSAVLVYRTEQSEEPTEEHRDYIRGKLRSAIASLDRGEGRAWDAQEIKNRVCHRAATGD